MKHQAWLVALLLGVLLPQGAAFAADPPLLTEADAVARALRREAPVKRGELRIKAQKARLDFAPHEVKNPELRMQDISTGYFDSDTNHQLRIGLRWQPPGYGELGLKTEKARVAWWEEKVKTGELRGKLIYEVRAVYAELQKLAEGAALAAQRSALEAKRLAAVAQLVQLGQRPFLERVKAQARALKASREAELLAARRTMQTERLAALIGERGEFSLEPLATKAPALAWDKVFEQALGGRPELARAKAVQAYEAARYREARLTLVPSFSFVELDYHYESRKKDSGELMFGIELPLFNWNLGELRATSLLRADSAVEAQAAKAEIENELKAAFARYVEARQAFVTVAASSKETRAALPGLIENAERSALPEDERLELQLALLDLDETSLEVRYQVRAALNELCRVAGAEDATLPGAD